MNVAELLATANQSKTGRGPSQWAPAACRVWREAELEMARLPIVYLLAGSGVFWALGVLAVYGPAWRAASTSPALATRSA